MTFELAKHVFAPGEGEVLVMHPPTAGQITILVDPTNTGETSLCTLIQTLDRDIVKCCGRARPLPIRKRGHGQRFP